MTVEGRGNSVREAVANIINSIRRYIVGYDDLLKLMLVAILSKGHILIEGVPGTGKTTVAKLFATAIGGKFRRVQMTPDLLPADIIGSYYFDVRRGEWVFREGSIFANIVFIDELNRAPPRTQSALLEAMQERQVTVDGVTHRLSSVFLVIATQMPVGSEGTYPLTPVLIDRFAYSYTTTYPDNEDLEMSIVLKSEEIERGVEISPIGLEVIDKACEEVSRIFVSEKVLRYIVRLVKFIRQQDEVLVPPSPRASIWLYRGGKALAYIEGEEFVVPDHIKWVARFVLPHRIYIKQTYQVEGVKPIDIVDRALQSVEVPK
jgi:MoxR-like ATPase